MGLRAQSAYTLLLVTADGLQRHPLPAEGVVSLGRAEGNQIRIDDVSVSRSHARLHIGTELLVEDLGASNGTRVGVRSALEAGQTQSLRALRRESARIAAGDRIMFGTVLAFIGRSEPVKLSKVVCDPHMLELHAQLARAANSPLSVLLLGETGVGKEVFARSLHEASPRKSGPFIEVNCAALPENLVEAELFGHEKGAFTGAVSSRAGLFESAHGGTLFLDEVGELPLVVQAKLLRALEERKVARVGGRTPIAFDARLVAATNRDLESLSERGEFRADLYFRIAALSLSIPPLRERRSEILPLAELFLARAAEELNRGPLTLPAEVMSALMQYSWPGNVRELRNAIQRTAVLADQLEIRVGHLPPRVQRALQEAPPLPSAALPEPGEPAAADAGRLKDQLRDIERQRIADALERCGGNQTRAAEELGMSRRTLVYRLREFEMPRPRSRS